MLVKVKDSYAEVQIKKPFWWRKGEVGRKGVTAFKHELIPLSPSFSISPERFFVGVFEAKSQEGVIHGPF
jgi:hypothetical protein